MNFTTPYPINSSETMKNGSKDGKTTSHHITKPRLDASNDSFGKKINPNATSEIEMASRIVFSLERVTYSPPANS